MDLKHVPLTQKQFILNLTPATSRVWRREKNEASDGPQALVLATRLPGLVHPLLDHSHDHHGEPTAANSHTFGHDPSTHLPMGVGEIIQGRSKEIGRAMAHRRSRRAVGPDGFSY